LIRVIGTDGVVRATDEGERPLVFGNFDRRSGFVHREGFNLGSIRVRATRDPTEVFDGQRLHIFVFDGTDDDEGRVARYVVLVPERRQFFDGSFAKV
jgi:hypothetical protein